jgi:hypothetical protein
MQEIVVNKRAVGADLSALGGFFDIPIKKLKQDSNERDSSSSTARSSPVMLSAAKHLAANRDSPCAEFPLSPFASLRGNSAQGLRVTPCDCSNSQGFFFTIEPCLNKILRPSIQADSSRPAPIPNFNDQHRPLRRRCIHARTADVSASGTSMRSPGRYIGGAPINCAPTGYSRRCLLNFIISSIIALTRPAHDRSNPVILLEYCYPQPQRVG